MPLASLMLQNGRPEKVLFYRGLESAGYKIADSLVPKTIEPDDILVIWNRLPTMDETAKKYEAAGARVVVAEHGWIGENTFSLCLNQHNGAGTWRVGAESRWPGFGIEVRPWRKSGDYVLVIPQRGIGVPPVAMPRNWREQTMNRLSAITDRPIRIRYPQDRIHPIWPEFEDCHCAVIWATGAGIKALTYGIPVFYEMPYWIGRLAATYGIGDLEKPYLGDRDLMFKALSWAMWKSDEIESGEALRWLLQR